MKIPMASAGVEPATFRFAAQRLNHCAIAVPAFLQLLYTLLDRRGSNRCHKFAHDVAEKSRVS